MSDSDPIIKYFFDDDFYKFTMWNAVRDLYSNVRATAKFINRNIKTPLGHLADDVRKQIDFLADLKPEQEILDMLAAFPFFDEAFFENIAKFRYNPRLCNVFVNNGELDITLSGKWQDIILFECKILAIVSELMTRQYEYLPEHSYSINQKAAHISQTDVKFADFGTRRRASFQNHNNVVAVLQWLCPDNFIGTSNVFLAYKNNLKPIGTMAHEYIQAHLGLTENMRYAQKRALYSWLEKYDNHLGIALTDTFTTDAFLKDFGYTLAKTYSGVRQDSGNPSEFANKMIDHYEKLGIDPKTKTIVFSDSLNFDKAIALHEEFSDRVNVVFGIGTFLTNDTGIPAPNIVLKMTSCNGHPVVKLSDVAGKNTGNPWMIDVVKKTFEVK